jgi:transposase
MVMANTRMPAKFFEFALPLLPAELEGGPQGGRPRIGHEVVLKVIWFVLVTGCRWKDTPQELGCCGETARTRLQAWEQAGIWSALHEALLVRLRKEGQLDSDIAIIDSTLIRAFGGGDKTGPSPVDRGKPGTKLTIMIDGKGVPLVCRAVPANRSDQQETLPTVLSYPSVPGKVGRPPTRPKQLYADAGYDDEAARTLLRWMGVEPLIRKRNKPHGSHLGRVRWVVERTISWIKGLRRMRVRYDRSALTIDAWTTIAAAVVCFNILIEATT